MAAEKKVWIQNGYRSSMEFIVKNEQTKESVSYVFDNYKTDRMSGRTITDGYTVLDESEYKMLLEKSKAFARLIEDGTLIKYDEAPLSAMSDVDRILALQEEVRVLKEENKALKEKLEKADKKSGKTETKSEDAKADK